jgi:IstB-like ATP binding protein/Mu transposase, C-terminal domain
VLIAERRIIARLRDRRFYSLAEANAAIRACVAEINARPFQKLDGSRQSLFEQLDHPALRPLPAARYEFATWRTARVNIDYHVAADKHYYSVPYQLARQQVDVRLSAATVEIFCSSKRVASHPRSHQRHGHTTDPAHMPEAHRQHAQWTPQRITGWAGNTGPAAAGLVVKILESRPHPEQGYRAALGIIRLAGRYGPQRAEAACARTPTAASSRSCAPAWTASRCPATSRRLPRTPLTRTCAAPATATGKDNPIMLSNAAIDGLRSLRLDAMAAALAEQNEQAGYAGLGFQERPGMLVDRELTERASRRVQRNLKAARLRIPRPSRTSTSATPRGLDRAHILDLAQARWAQQRRAIVITGPTGTGKTHLACALAHAAIRNGHTAFYQRAPQMLDELAIARGDSRRGIYAGQRRWSGAGSNRRPSAFQVETTSGNAAGSRLAFSL